jgi:hypothetical protein
VIIAFKEPFSCGFITDYGGEFGRLREKPSQTGLYLSG